MRKLKEYEAKRQLKSSLEPKAKIATSKKKGHLRFVIQKHAASHLHYDLRLEHDGVLLSWAVPKGPSLNPIDKRLAVRVEDHPYSYRSFEGVIPEGNYGAGTVMVWDEGTYIAENIDEGLDEGHLYFILHGKKLNGGFTLIKMKKSGQWLLIKKKDEEASTKDVTKKDRSVKTDRTMNQITKDEHLG